MSRKVTIIACCLALGCGGKSDTDDPSSTGSLTPDDPEPSEEDTGTGSTFDPTAEITEPPTDVDADCWSWSVTADQDGVLWGVVMQTYEPGDLALLSWFSDFEPDGDWEYVAVYTWDASFEHILRYEYDYDNDGVLDRLIEQEYDAASGHRLVYREDADGDGILEREWLYVWVGDLLMEAHADEDGDRLTDTWWRYTYDAQDRVLAIEGDDGDDGTVDAMYAYTWDDTVAEGRAYTQTFDDDMDGVPEETSSYVYDALDQRTHYEFENDAGDLYVRDYTYNTDGDLATYTSSTIWEGVFNDAQYAVYTYEAPGRVSSLVNEIDFTGEGEPDIVLTEVTTWACP